MLCVNTEHPQLNCKIQELHLYIFIYKNYISTRRWSNERIKTKTTMFQENSNALTNTSWKTRFKQNLCRPATPISPRLYMNVWPKSRQIDVYMIKSAKIYIFSKYMRFCKIYAQLLQKKLNGGILVETSPRP